MELTDLNKFQYDSEDFSYIIHKYIKGNTYRDMSRSALPYLINIDLIRGDVWVHATHLFYYWREILAYTI